MSRLTLKEYEKWVEKNCDYTPCKKCIFYNVFCNTLDSDCWVKHKELYSDNFLDQEIEVEE